MWNDFCVCVGSIKNWEHWNIVCCLIGFKRHTAAKKFWFHANQTHVHCYSARFDLYKKNRIAVLAVLVLSGFCVSFFSLLLWQECRSVYRTSLLYAAVDVGSFVRFNNFCYRVRVVRNLFDFGGLFLVVQQQQHHHQQQRVINGFLANHV